MELYVYRHAMMDTSKNDSSGKEGPGLSDFGRSQIEKLQSLVGILGLKPGVVLTSPMKRARETAELAVKMFWVQSRIVETDKLLPKASIPQLYEEINSFGKEKQIVVVTHYPLIKELLSSALGTDFGPELLNGSLLRIDFKGRASRGKGKLVSIISPPTD